MERPPIIVTGSTYPKLASDVAKILNCEMCTGIQDAYTDSEINPILKESVRRRDVFIIQSTCPPNVNKAYMELNFMVSECVRSSAGEITVVSPYTGYARGDRFNEKRTTIPIGDVLRNLRGLGANRYVTLDMHQEASLVAFYGPVDHLYSSEVLVPQMKEEIKNSNLQNVVIAATDQGGTKMIEAYARILRENNVDIVGTAYAIQNRNKITNKKEITGVTGDVEGANVFIVDDIIASGSTAINAGNEFKKEGAKSLRLVAPHGLFLDWNEEPITSLERFKNSSIEQILTTDTVALKEDVLNSTDYVRLISVAPLLAAAILCIHTGDSITRNLRNYINGYIKNAKFLNV